MTRSFHHHLKSTPAQLLALSDAFGQFAELHGVPPAVRFAADLALEEVVANIIFHGYGGAPDQLISVAASLFPSELVLNVEDSAPPFNPLEVPPPNLAVPPDERPIGGLGIHLTRRMMDSLEYARAGDHNILTMRKRLPQ